eukprot:CAMPEP_0172496894 /NCGR_PEP_ID=MMETSP1066-20121228/94667_1 /TAXON_ID=671091 /ORGANISM="Coscinodiscus wailesii, Strain CCMP2513" /LENGTH=470 /DNA_ID=CAMNT_0013269433 /DNA_START=66 /DNA_END=1478 /DNA_ORIENTATION=+
MASKAKPITSLLRAKLPPNTPPSVLTVPFVNNPLPPDSPRPNAVVCPAGTCHSAYLFEPHLAPDETSGLSHRLQIMSRNKSLSSVLISFAEKYYVDNNEGTYTPRSSYANSKEAQFSRMSAALSPEPPHQLSFEGYRHPIPPEDRARTLDALSNLALCTHDPRTKIPVVFAAGNATISDGGYALSLCSHYTVCSASATYRVTNPRRGLSFDPIGLSFVLTRLGVDDDDDVLSDLSLAMGRMVSLGGYEMSGTEMVGVGMGTHLVYPPGDGDEMVNLLEYELGNLTSFESQVFLERPRVTQAEATYRKQNAIWDDDDLVNQKYKNQTVHELLRDMTDGVSSKVGEVDIVTIAAMLKDTLERESLEGVIEGFKELQDNDNRLGRLAKDFLTKFEERSPLALAAVDKLLMKANDNSESLESCAAREKTVLMNLIKGKDYKNWVANGLEKVEWTHQSINEVSSDEIDELFGDDI